MSKSEVKLLLDAVHKYKHIRPCGFNKTLEDGFKKYDKFLCFWFNSKDGNTHLVKRAIS